MIGLSKQTHFIYEPGVEYLSQYIQLVLESLYIFAGLKTFVLSSYCHSSLCCKSHHNNVCDSLVSLIRVMTHHTPTYSKFNNQKNQVSQIHKVHP